MIHLIRTNNHHEDFKLLVIELDKELKIRDGDDHTFYAQYNKSDNIKYVLVAYDQELPIACEIMAIWIFNFIFFKKLRSTPLKISSSTMGANTNAPVILIMEGMSVWFQGLISRILN